MYVHMLIIPLVPYCEWILEQSTEMPNLLKELQVLNTIATVLISLLMHLRFLLSAPLPSETCLFLGQDPAI